MQKRKIYYSENKDLISLYIHRYYKDEKNKIKRRVYHNNYIINKIKTNINFKLSHKLRDRLRKALKGNYKSGSAVRDLGCSIEKFKKHIEDKFTIGMSWTNYGKFGWHIDHIIPISKFNLNIRSELLKAVHYTNMQPLWATTDIARKHGDMNSIGNINKGDQF